jgi:hypothetical protein
MVIFIFTISTLVNELKIEQGRPCKWVYPSINTLCSVHFKDVPTEFTCPFLQVLETIKGWGA